MSNRWNFAILTDPGALTRPAVADVFRVAARHGFGAAAGSGGRLAGSSDAGDDLRFRDAEEAAAYVARHDGLVVLWSPPADDLDIWVSFQRGDPATAPDPSQGLDACRFGEVSFSVPESVLGSAPAAIAAYRVLTDLAFALTRALDAPFGYVLSDYAAEEVLPDHTRLGLVPCAEVPLVAGWLTWFGPRYADRVGPLASAVGGRVRRADRHVVVDLGPPWRVSEQEIVEANRRLRDPRGQPT